MASGSAHGVASAFVGRYFDPNDRRVHIKVEAVGHTTVSFNISGTKMDGRFGPTKAAVQGGELKLWNLTGIRVADGGIEWSNAAEWRARDDEWVADAIPSDHYHVCRSDNTQTHREHIVMPASPRGLAADDPRARRAAPYRTRKLRPPKWHQSLSDVPGRLAVATVIGRTSSPRYQDARPNADQLPCAIVLQFISLRDIGGIPFSRAGQGGKFEYVVIVSDDGTETEAKIFDAYGIRVVRASMPPAERYPAAFERGAMMKVHGISLDEYERVLLLDGDMFANAPIVDHFRIDFAEDMVTSEHSSSPCSGNWIIVRPNRHVYEAVMPVVAERRFNFASGWNYSGLYTWADNRDELPCEAPSWAHQPPDCKPNDMWVERCRRFLLTNWIWMGASEVQGFFPWVYNLSGLGTMRSLPSGWVSPRDGPKHLPLGQGQPWWTHFQGGTKPWIMGALSREICPGEKFHRPAEWFWNDFWPAALARKPEGKLQGHCPSFAPARDKYFQRSQCSGRDRHDDKG